LAWVNRPLNLSDSILIEYSNADAPPTALEKEKRGKGSHVTLYFGDRLTVVRNPKDELKTGTLHAMCKQLGIRRDEL
jgi:hypothetical protein